MRLSGSAKRRHWRSILASNVTGMASGRKAGDAVDMEIKATMDALELVKRDDPTDIEGIRVLEERLLELAKRRGK